MAVTHLISTILRPGIQSIQVQYKYQSAEVWTNYNEGQRVPGGVEVKFVVTTYPNFTLTSWEAYYADEYDDTVSLTLTSVTGESAWTFTMPSAEVYIRCEANSAGSGLPLTVNTLTAGTVVGTVTSFYEAYTFYNDNRPDIVGNWNASVLSQLDNYVRSNFNGNSFHVRTGYFSYDGGNAMWVVILVEYNFKQGQQVNYSDPPIQHSFIANNDSDTGIPSVINTIRFWRVAAGPRDENFEGISTTFPGQYNRVYFSATAAQSLTSTNSIRYIMSPENSGEIDASAPSTFEQGTTEFTFKWRIKAAYEFKRLTPFAVGEGPLETAISHSIDSYDGDTRTYTFTVTQIPDWAKGVNVVIDTIMLDDPADNGGTNSSDSSIGGDGTFDDISDHVPLPGIPAGISASDSGLVTLFRPTISQVKDFGNYLWSHITEFWENLQKIFTSPMDYVIAFNILPVTPAVGSNRDIYIGNWISNIQMPPVLNQFYEFNAGTIQIKEYFGSFLDYAPNTRARIMLPFIGDRDLAINEIMGKTLHLWYRIDLLSGSCVAILNANDDVYYQWSGNCAVAIPVTGSDWSRLYSAVGRIATIGAGFAAFGAGGAMMSSTAVTTASGASRASAVADAARAFNNTPKGVPGVAHERALLLNAMENAGQSQVKTITSQSSRAISGSHLGAIVGHNMMGAVPRVQHTGDMSGAITIMGNRTPYIVLEYPNVNLPNNYKHFYGYPSNQYAVLGNLAGFTQCKEVLFESGTATDDEIEMIVSALKGGVYL